MIVSKKSSDVDKTAILETKTSSELHFYDLITTKSKVRKHVLLPMWKCFDNLSPRKNGAGADEYTDGHLLTNPKKIEKSRTFVKTPTTSLVE